MAARFQIDIERRTLGLGTSPFECDDLGVIPSGEVMKAGGNDFFPPYQHGTDHRVGTGPAGSLEREAAGLAQIAPVGISPFQVGQLFYSLLWRGPAARSTGAPLRSLMSSSNSTMNSLMSLNER